MIADYLQARQFVVGERFGLADIMLVSCLDWAHHYGFDLPDSLARYREHAAQRAAYQRAYTANFAGLLQEKRHGTA